MLLNILKAFLIGICASAPIGPIAILVMQKSLSYGQEAGFVTGLGATLVDTLYAVISIFALAIAQQFLETFEYPIYIAGGLIVGVLGYTMAFRDPFRKMTLDEENKGIPYLQFFLQAVVSTLSNPGAVLVMFALFAFFEVDVTGEPVSVFPIILAVAAGSAVWWYFCSWLFSRWKDRINMKALFLVSRISGIVVMIIGIALLGEGLFQVSFGRIQ